MERAAAAPIVHDVMTELFLRDPAAKPVFVASASRTRASPADGRRRYEDDLRAALELPRRALAKKLLLLNWPFLLLITAITASASRRFIRWPEARSILGRAGTWSAIASGSASVRRCLIDING